MSAPSVLIGLPAAPGVAMGRALRVDANRVQVPRYLLAPEEVAAELARWTTARQAAAAELQRLCASLGDGASELAAVLEVHLLLLQDDVADAAVREQIRRHRYNAEWALLAQADEFMRPLAAADDAYLRARKADIEQVRDHVLRSLMATRQPADDGPLPIAPAPTGEPRILVAHDLSPADLLRLKQRGFAGFVTDVGGMTGHTAIVARSMGIPAVVGAGSASKVVQPDDQLLLDGAAGKIWINPAPEQMAAFERKQCQWRKEQRALALLRDRPARTLDDQAVELLANIERPEDGQAARAAGAVGVGLFRTEFLFMGRSGNLPDEEEQFAAYRRLVEAMDGAPVTIRSVDIGADKPLDDTDDRSLNPALSLRAIRWSLSRPDVFLTQLRAILRAAAFGDVRLLIPMLTHARQIHQTLALLTRAREQLSARGLRAAPLPVGAMIEVPGAALTVPTFLRHFDFLSIGTNDLIQYTLAVDRADASLAELFDPLHPAVLRLVADTIAAGHAAGKPVTVCGEMAGDTRLTRLLLGLGLRSFSMQAGQIPAVKREILRTRCADWRQRARKIVRSDEPGTVLRTFA